MCHERVCSIEIMRTSEMDDFVLQENNSRYSFGKSRKTGLGNLMASE